MTDLLIILGLVLVVAYLWSAIRSKEIAIKMGAAKCAREGVQFLDETVERRKLRFTLDPRNNPSWYREFHFEFATDGEFRYEGVVAMYGQQVYRVEMDPYPEQVGNSINSDDQNDRY